MKPIGAIRGSIAVEAGRSPRSEAAAPHRAKPASARALIPLQPVARADASIRPQAGFLAHLIATDGKLPQTRERRRAEPADAIAAYAVAGRAPRPRTGRRLFRTG